jgi:hypothetical protein
LVEAVHEVVAVQSKKNKSSRMMQKMQSNVQEASKKNKDEVTYRLNKYKYTNTCSTVPLAK